MTTPHRPAHENAHFRSVSIALALVVLSVFPTAVRAEGFEQHRLAQRDEKRHEGLWLLGWGVANTLGGSLAAGLMRHDDAWLAGSVTTLSFGAINTVLALGLLDLSGERRRAILAEATTSAERITRLREREIASQLRSGQVFALNAGLDIAYMTAGALLYALGARHAQDLAWARGAGLSMSGQGVFLLGFDVVCWMRSNRRAVSLRAQASLFQISWL